MSSMIREIWIDAPKRRVWEILADFGNTYLYSPSIPKSYTINGNPTGLGAERHCDLNIAGAWVEERIVEWDEGQMMSIQIYDGKKTPPWKNASGTFYVSERGNGTQVRFEFAYEMKYGPVGALMDRFLVQPQFGKAIGGVLAGLKHYTEKGQEVKGARGLPFEQLIVVPA